MKSETHNTLETDKKSESESMEQEDYVTADSGTESLNGIIAPEAASGEQSMNMNTEKHAKQSQALMSLKRCDADRESRFR